MEYMKRINRQNEPMGSIDEILRERSAKEQPATDVIVTHSTHGFHIRTNGNLALDSSAVDPGRDDSWVSIGQLNQGNAGSGGRKFNNLI